MTKDKLPNNPRFFSNTNFNNAVLKLNRYNLTDPWELSSLLLCIEYYAGWETGYHFLFRLLHVELICRIDKAVLASSARNYKKEKFNSKYLGYILNLLSDESMNIHDRVLNFFK